MLLVLRKELNFNDFRPLVREQNRKFITFVFA